GAQFEILRAFREGQEMLGRGEKRAGVASRGARAAVVARGMICVTYGELCDAVMKIWDINLFRVFLQDVVETSETKRGQILDIGIARPVLDGTGHSDHALDTRVVRGDLGVG